MTDPGKQPQMPAAELLSGPKSTALFVMDYQPGVQASLPGLAD
jgi:hypothetical protein